MFCLLFLIFNEKGKGMHEEICPEIPSLDWKSWQLFFLSQLYMFNISDTDSLCSRHYHNTDKAPPGQHLKTREQGLLICPKICPAAGKAPW